MSTNNSNNTSNTNINNDINKFDGKYLKCVVSKYNSSIKYLANSGTLIILQPSNAINRNYIYLGNEFLASGYGFSSEENQIKGESIVKEFDNIVKALQKANDKETEDREKQYNEIIKTLRKYVLINGGHIENTVIELNGQKILTKDIILYGEEAQYKNLEVDNIIVTITGNNDYQYKVNFKNNDIVVDFPIGTEITNIQIEIITKDNDSGGLEYLEVLHDFKRYDADENEGVLIKYDCDTENTVNTIIEDEINSSYNLHKYIYHYKIAEDVENYLSDIINWTEELNELNNISPRDNAQEARKIELENLLEQISNKKAPVIVTEKLLNILKGLYLYVKETPITSLKNYPGLEAKGIKILSTGNKILANKINTKLNVSINPIYFAQWAFLGYNKNNKNFTEFNIINSFNNNSLISANNKRAFNNLHQYEALDIHKNINILHIDLSDKFKDSQNILNELNNQDILDENSCFDINICIPSNFSLSKAYLVSKYYNDDLDINGNNDYKNDYKHKYDKFNITGITKIYAKNIKMPTPLSQCLMGEYYYCIDYDIYKIRIDSTTDQIYYGNTNKLIFSPIHKDKMIELIVVNNNVDNYELNHAEKLYDANCESIDDNNLKLNNTINENDANVLNQLINDEEFNSLYWLNGYYNNEYIKSQINKYSQNGITNYIEYIDNRIRQ